MSAMKVIALSLLDSGQDEQESGMDQVYTGSGDDDAVQFNVTSLLALTSTVLFCGQNSFGDPKLWLEKLMVVIYVATWF